MISAISGSGGGATAPSGSVQQQFQVAAMRSAQQLLAQQVQTLLKGVEPGKGGNLDAFA